MNMPKLLPVTYMFVKMCVFHLSLVIVYSNIKPWFRKVVANDIIS